MCMWGERERESAGEASWLCSDRCNLPASEALGGLASGLESE